MLFAAGILDFPTVCGWARTAYYKTVGAFGQAASKPARPLHDVELARQCRANLRLIEGAKRSIGEHKTLTTGYGVSWDDINAELKKKKIPLPLRCPAGGTYTLTPLGTNCRCSIGANNTPGTEDDHLYLD